MDLTHKKKRKEARKLFLAGDCSSNAEIARRLGLKPHTVAKYRKEEDWDGLRLKSDRYAAERMAKQCASDRVSLEVKHYNYWEAVLRQVGEKIKANVGKIETKELAELSSMIEKAQRGQRLARGLSLDGETEQQIRAQAEADHRAIVDAFIESVKKHVTDPEIQELIAKEVMAKFPGSPEEDLTS